MKLCFSTLGCTEKSLEEVIALARRFGINALEIRGIASTLNNGEIEDFKEENATKTKERLHSAGLSPVVLGTSCMFHTEELSLRAQKEGEEAILIAERMGIPYIRVFGNNIAGERNACIKAVTEGVRRLCDFAIGKGVCVLLEVHGDFNTVENLAPILKALGTHPHFGLIWDIAHSHEPYGKDFMRFYSAVRPYIRHVHIKDKKVGEGLVLPGEGEVPILPIVKQMLADGYEGCFSLEWERLWHPSLLDIETALARFCTLLSEDVCLQD